MTVIPKQQVCAGFSSEGQVLQTASWIWCYCAVQNPLASVKFMRQKHTHTRRHREERIHLVSVLTKVYEHLAVALPHVLWHGEDAGHVVVQERVLLLQKENKSINTTVWVTWGFSRLISVLMFLNLKLSWYLKRAEETFYAKKSLTFFDLITFGIVYSLTLISFSYLETPGR